MLYRKYSKLFDAFMSSIQKYKTVEKRILKQIKKGTLKRAENIKNSIIIKHIILIQMSKQKGKQKSTEDYRRDIFTLKNQIKQEEGYLEQIKQKCSEVDIFAQQSYTYQMKMKILANDLEAVKQKINKYAKDQCKYFYELNFCAYAMSRACLIVGINCQMIFRMIDVEAKGVVKTTDFGYFFREVLRLDSILANPILNQLDPKQTGEITQTRYTKLLKLFMLDSQRPEPTVQPIGGQLKQTQVIEEQNQMLNAVQRVCIQMVRMQIRPNEIWKTELVNIATTAGGLKKKMKDLDNLDCVAVYCRCDPTKQGVVESQKIVLTLQNQIEGLRKFDSGGLKKIKLKQAY